MQNVLISYAGGEWYNNDNSSNNTSYYLYTGQWYWGLSPSSFYYGYSSVFGVHTTGYLHDPFVNTPAGRVLPVVSLKANTLVSGGTPNKMKNNTFILFYLLFHIPMHHSVPYNSLYRNLLLFSIKFFQYFSIISCLTYLLVLLFYQLLFLFL